MTLILDIDDVLLHHGRNPPSRKTEFRDWRKPNPRTIYVEWYSPEQLDLIQRCFPHIEWHTSWVQNSACHEIFEPVCNFRHNPIFINRLFSICAEMFLDDVHLNWFIDPHKEPRLPLSMLPYEIVKPIVDADWWKLNAVAAAFLSGKLEDDKILWVDNDLKKYNKPVTEVIEFLGLEERVRMIAPDQVWTRRSILEAKEWYET